MGLFQAALLETLPPICLGPAPNSRPGWPAVLPQDQHVDPKAANSHLHARSRRPEAGTWLQAKG